VGEGKVRVLEGGRGSRDVRGEEVQGNELGRGKRAGLKEGVCWWEEWGKLVTGGGMLWDNKLIRRSEAERNMNSLGVWVRKEVSGGTGEGRGGQRSTCTTG